MKRMKNASGISRIRNSAGNLKMKQLTRLFASGVLLLALLLQTACGAAASKPGFVGKWLFASMESGGETMTAAQLGSMDLITMEFLADGTAKMSGETEASGKWTEKDGTLTITDDENGLKDTATLKDADTMILKNEEDTITMVRDGSDAAKKIAAAIASGASDSGGADSMKAAADTESMVSTAMAGDTGSTAESSTGSGSKDTASGTESAASGKAESGGTDSTAAQTGAGSFAEVTVQNSQIFNQEGIAVDVTGFSIDDYYGPALNVRITNSSDKDMAVQTYHSSVNGYMISFQLWEVVAAGKKANSEIYMPATYLQDAGIDTVAELEFEISLEDPTDYTTLMTSDPITVQTSAYGSYKQADKDNGTELYNKDGIRIVSLGYGTDAFMNQAVMIFADNQTDKSIEVAIDKASVDGTMTDATLYMDLLPGKKGVSGITFYDTLTDPQELDCVFTIEDMATYEYIDETEHMTIPLK